MVWTRWRRRAYPTAPSTVRDDHRGELPSSRRARATGPRRHHQQSRRGAGGGPADHAEPRRPNPGQRPVVPARQPAAPMPLDAAATARTGCAGAPRRSPAVTPRSRAASETLSVGGESGRAAAVNAAMASASTRTRTRTGDSFRVGVESAQPDCAAATLRRRGRSHIGHSPGCAACWCPILPPIRPEA